MLRLEAVRNWISENPEVVDDVGDKWIIWGRWARIIIGMVAGESTKRSAGGR